MQRLVNRRPKKWCLAPQALLMQGGRDAWALIESIMFFSSKFAERMCMRVGIKKV